MVRTRRQIPVNSIEKDEEDEATTFLFQDITYCSYEEMVKAKRKRNADMLISSGLLEASAKLRHDAKIDSGGPSGPSRRGIRASKKRTQDLVVLPRRKSSRVAGVQADGLYIAEERSGGRVTVGGGGSSDLIVNNKVETLKETDEFFNDRVNDGSDLSLNDAVEMAGSKWVKDDSVSDAQKLVRDLAMVKDENRRSPKSIISTVASQVDDLNIDNPECVAKVVPDRIYAVAFHPSPHRVVAAAGDKQGHVGIWNVDAASNEDGTNGVHLFRPHNRVVSNVEWTSSGDRLLSSSYDGSIRMFDVQKEVFIENFATYDSSDEYKGKLGYGLHEGRKFWVQYSCVDHRNENCLFLSTSMGNVIHADLREKGKITFNQQLSEKKINSVSLHKNGNTMATCGLDCTVQLWDIRKFTESSSRSPPVNLSTMRSTKSINSAFFSPSGKYLLTTNMSDTLDIITDAHTHSGIIKSPTHRIRHNNRTGRWLSTFMAQWHPSDEEDIFLVGSMQQPRTLEIFDGSVGKLVRGIQGDALTAVVSRCCFHPSSDHLIAMGGNSSGRVNIFR